MSSPILGEIKMFAGTFAPRGYAFCSGQLMAISQNTALFSLLGTTYGGDGVTTFALPDLRGRAPIHPGNGIGLTPHVEGEKGGQESVALNTSQMPSHDHQIGAVNDGGNQAGPSGNLPAIESTGTSQNYSNNSANVNMNSGMVSSAGQSQPHENMPPYLCVNFIIAVTGIYPSRN